MQKSGYISVPSNILKKHKSMTVTSYYVYLLFRNKLAYRKGMKGKLFPVTDIVTFSYAEAKKAGIDSKLFSKTIKNLVNVDLIKIKSRGMFGGRTPTEYKVF